MQYAVDSSALVSRVIVDRWEGCLTGLWLETAQDGLVDER